MGAYVQVFKRYEKKYMLSPQQYEKLLELFQEKMAADGHGLHTISTIYLDSHDYAMIRQSLEKPLYKEKIRVRSYGITETNRTVYLELKKKYDGIVYKRRAAMTLEALENYLATGIVPETREPQIMKEIDYAMNMYRPVKKVLINYERLAMAGIDDPELRITFDHHIRYRSDNLDLSQGSEGREVVKPGYVLMEIKTTKGMPLWLVEMLKTLNILPSSFSKYGYCFQHYLMKDFTAYVRGINNPKNNMQRGATL